MVWTSHDTSDDVGLGIDSIKIKPFKKRSGSRAGGLSRYYSSKSQSFSSLDRVQCTPFGTSALALAKHPSSFDLRRYASGLGAGSVGGTSPIHPAAPRFRPSASFRESSPEEGEEGDDGEGEMMADCCAVGPRALGTMDESDAGGVDGDGEAAADCGAGPTSRCPCNDTIFGHPCDSFISPAASPDRTPLQLYGSCGLTAAAAAAAGVTAAAQQQLQQQQVQLTSDYLERLGALLPGQPLGLPPFSGGGAAAAAHAVPVLASGLAGGSSGWLSEGGAECCTRTASGCSGLLGASPGAGTGLGNAWPAYPAMMPASCRGSAGGAAIGGLCDGDCGLADRSWHPAPALPHAASLHALHPSCSSEWNNDNSSGGGCLAVADGARYGIGSGGPDAGGWYRHSVSAGGCYPGASGGVAPGSRVAAAEEEAACPAGGGGGGGHSYPLRHGHGHGGAAVRDLAASKMWGSTENLIASLSIADKKHPTHAVSRRSFERARSPSPAASGGCAVQHKLQQQQQPQAWCGAKPAEAAPASQWGAQQPAGGSLPSQPADGVGSGRAVRPVSSPEAMMDS